MLIMFSKGHGSWRKHVLPTHETWLSFFGTVKEFYDFTVKKDWKTTLFLKPFQRLKLKNKKFPNQ